MTNQIFNSYDEFKQREDKSVNGFTKQYIREFRINLKKDNGNMGC